MLKLFNTLTRKKEEFKPIESNKVRFYACGLTVYNYAHIGNLRTYIFEDVLKRVLLFNGYDLKHVMNITDVGHLTGENLGDADTGEDKVEKAAKKLGKTVKDITDFYTNEFKKDLNSLNILFPDIWCKATDHITEMIDLIKRIEANGFTYQTGGNVYFDTSKFEHYSDLGKLKLDDQKAGARVNIDKNKKNPRDFVLWFTESEKFKDHLMKWDSPWGRGWPGWHIECSAMASKYLGEQFDIHSGGIDHINVHHTNEIAQSESAFGKHPWVKFWLHGEFLVLEKEKMSKSLSNFITIRTLIDRGFDPLHYRYLCFTAHYRKQLVFTEEALLGAKQSFEILKSRIINLKNEVQGEIPIEVNEDQKYYKEFLTAINDDLNMPRALAVVYDLLKANQIENKEKLSLLYKFDEILGFNIKDFKEESVQVDEELERLVQERQTARKNKDFKRADEIRNILKDKGYIIKDTPEGPKLQQI